MALPRTDLLAEAHSGNVGPGGWTTSAFTPDNDSLLVVAVAATDLTGTAGIGAALDIDDTAGLDWTRRVTTYDDSGSGAYDVALVIWTAPVTTGESMTVTVTSGGRNVASGAVIAVCYTGHDTDSPIGATAAGRQTGGWAGPPDPFAITLSDGPGEDSEVIAIVARNQGSAGTTPGPSPWEELVDVDATGSAIPMAVQVQTRGGSTSTSVSWVDLRPGGAGLFFAIGKALEIRAAGEGSGPEPGPDAGAAARFLAFF